MKYKVRNYTVSEKIGQGGMGIVYKARHTVLDRDTVIKVFQDAGNGDGVERFKREAKLTSSLHHSNIVNVYDYFSDEKNHYLFIEYIDGEDLKAILDYSKKIPAKVAACIVWEILDALEYAHSFDIIHRDIKPENILISQKGEVKLCDFGVAKISMDHGLTTTGTLIGTPYYISPEQALGEEATHQSDIYSAGVLLYELTTGEKPFISSDTQTLIQKIIRGKAESPRKSNPRIGFRLNHIIKKAMQKSSKKRYSTANQMKQSLSKYLKTEEATVRKKIIRDFILEQKQIKESSDSESLATTQVIHDQPQSQKLFVPLKYKIAALSISAALILLVAVLGVLHISSFRADYLGNIKVTTNTPGAVLYLNGEEIYKFKQKGEYVLKNIYQGMYNITVDAGDYYTRHSAIIFVEPAKMKVVHLPLRERSKMATFRVKSNREGTSVELGGSEAKQLPAKWITKPGEVEISAALKNFLPINRKMDVDIDEEREVLVEMINKDRDVLRTDYQNKPHLFDLRMKLLVLLQAIGLVDKNIKEPGMVEEISTK